VAEQFFPDLCESNNDPRAHLHFTDGIAWLRECGTGQYDVIIVDGTDPEGPGATLFSKAFYDCCASALKTNGILVGQTESPLFHMDLIRTVHQTLRQSGFKATRTLHFPQCTYPSGWWSVTMAGADLDTTPRPAQGMNTRYYTPQIHQAAAVLPAFMTSELD
jgi:spermidine synthase